MSFPIRITRGARPPIEIMDANALHVWRDTEKQAWQWLLATVDWQADESLHARVVEKQLSALLFLDGVLQDTAQLNVDEVQAITQELRDCYGTSNALLADDAGAANVIAASKENPVLSLGMLAQALDVVVESQSAITFAGRQAWLNNLPGSLVAAIPDELEALTKAFDEAHTQLENLRLAHISAPSLQALQQEASRNFTMMGGILVAMIAWLVLGSFLAMQIHYLTAPSVSPGPLNGQWVWLQWTERYTLYIFLFSCLFLGLRWAGRLLQDTWATAQSAQRRWTILSVVLADKARDLITRDEKDRERIRATVFGDSDQKPQPAAKSDDNLPLEALDKLLDLLKKARETVLPTKSEDK